MSKYLKTKILLTSKFLTLDHVFRVIRYSIFKAQLKSFAWKFHNGRA
jgi:hypothetical protein